MRWIYSRSLIKQRIYNSDGVIEKTDFIDIKQSDKNEFSQVWLDAYAASRNLYFVLLDISLISRKNLDLVYPFLAHIYYVQWSLLENIVRVFLNDGEALLENNLTSFRSVTRFVQSKFREIDEEYGGREKIAPSHFDYEFIYTKLKTNLNDVVTINDETSRVRISILQQKYFFHDDHSDQEFRMDWTLSHMFSPSAYYLLKNAEEKNKKLTDISGSSIEMAKKVKDFKKEKDKEIILDEIIANREKKFRVFHCIQKK